jgi:hypothetical protein
MQDIAEYGLECPCHTIRVLRVKWSGFGKTQTQPLPKRFVHLHAGKFKKKGDAEYQDEDERDHENDK